MSISLDISTFAALDLPQKVTFFDEAFVDELRNVDNPTLNSFLSEIVFDVNENTYIRKKALDSFVDLAILGEIKNRQALTLLIDRWSGIDDDFLIIKRIRALYLFYSFEPSDIENAIQGYTKSENTELVSEAWFNLGLIEMQKGFMAEDSETCKQKLAESQRVFLLACQTSENRIDAHIFHNCVAIVLDFFSGSVGSASTSIIELDRLVFHKEAFSFKIKSAPLYIGFYRTLLSINAISNSSPGSWLDFRQGLKNLFNQYASIKNNEIKDSLSSGLLSKVFIQKINEQFLEPFFVLNFFAEQIRLEAMIQEAEEGSDEAEFLAYIKQLLANPLSKKKVESDFILQSIRRIFPDVDGMYLESSIARLTAEDNIPGLISLFERLSIPTTQRVTDKIVSACLKLQSSRLYYGNFSEDDRNTFISNMLESSGLFCKDQTRRSISAAGKSAGEIDILIQDSQGNPISIIEALNLTSIDSAYISLHFDKIFIYDANGLSHNYILIYSNSPNFSAFYSRYKDFVSGYNFTLPKVKFEELANLPYTDLKEFITVHKRNEQDTILHHIVVNLFSRDVS